MAPKIDANRKISEKREETQENEITGPPVDVRVCAGGGEFSRRKRRTYMYQIFRSAEKSCFKKSRKGISQHFTGSSNIQKKSFAYFLPEKREQLSESVKAPNKFGARSLLARSRADVRALGHLLP